MSNHPENPGFGPSGNPPRPPMEMPTLPPPPPPPPPQGWGAPYPPPPPPSRSGGGVMMRVFTGLFTTVFITSLMLNIYAIVPLLGSATSGPVEVDYADGDANNRIVILPINGQIDESTGSFVRQALIVLRKNKPKAIVLRVNSPGGGVTASDQIWHELTEYRKETGVPIVASYGSIAASGGVYVSALSDYIVAEPTSLTGSIGVIAEAFTFQELMNKVGVTSEIVHSTHATKKDMLNPFRAWTDSDRSALRAILDQAHTRFVKIVADGRKKPVDKIADLATGEVFTTQVAIEKGLVDEEGYIDVAIEKARVLGKIPDSAGKPKVTKIETIKPFSLLSAMGSSSVPPVQSQTVSGEQLRQWVTELSTPRVEYRLTNP